MAIEDKQLQVIPWTWRDGSVHLEMRLASFHNENGELFTHLDGGRGLFVTACDVPWWGVCSSSGLGHSQRVSCPDCKRLLASMTFHAEIS